MAQTVWEEQSWDPAGVTCGLYWCDSVCAFYIVLSWGERPSYLYYAKWFEQGRGLGLRAQVLKEAGYPLGGSVMTVIGTRRMKLMGGGENPEPVLKARSPVAAPYPSSPQALFAE